MNKVKLFSFFLVLILCAETGYALTARQIMEKNDALPKGATVKQESVLVIFKGGQQEKKEFVGLQKRYGKKTRRRITFSFPTHLEFMVWDAPGEESSQWIKLSSGKVRKIASADKGNAWVNSHFYNEDIGEVNLDDFTYTLLGDADVNGVACYKIEAKKIKSKVYSKSIFYIGKNDFVVRKVEFYEKGRHTKTCTMEKIEKISGIYTTRKMVMERTDGKGKSIMYIKSVQYNTSVPDQKFNIESF